MTEITWKNGKRKLSDLIPWDKNPRQLTDAQAERLEESISEFGYSQPVEIDPDNKIIDGHQRGDILHLMDKFGDDAEIDVRIASRPFSEQERKKYVMLKHEGATGDWDFDALSDLYDESELKDWGFPDWQMENLSFGEPEPPPEPAEPQTNRADELRDEWQVETGQLWRLPSRAKGNEHRLICGDCTDKSVIDRVMGGEFAKYGMHDPPYGINVVVASDSGGDKLFANGRIGFDKVVKTNAYAPIVGDDKPFDPSHLLDLAEFNFLWGGNYYADKLSPQKGWIVWDKKGREDWHDNFSDCELAWTDLPIVTRIFRHTWMGMVQEGEREKRVHPTQKPAALYQKIISECFKDEGGIIIDFYSGSSPTIIAAENLSRQCRAIEISPAYVAVALQRYKDTFGIEPELIN